jgi:nitroreductase/NAD-dependent dihydropyrimidine dehydrogenase PreA subunit
LKINGLNDEKCIKCLDCVKECPSNLYYKPPTKTGERRRVFFEDPLDRCSRCGHCIAICPTEAILFDDADQPMQFEEAKNPSSILDYNNMIKLLRSRRSIRRFKQEPVVKEDLEAILEAMRYAPSASNKQSWKYIILNTPESIEKLRGAVIKMMNLGRKLLKYAKFLKPFIPKSLKEAALDPGTKISLNRFFERIKNGEDPVFYNAPAVVVTYAPSYGNMAGCDAGIALTYGMLAAQSLGLGTCWIGFAQEALARFKKNRKLLGIPKKMKVNGVFIVGRPAVKYKRVPPREPLNVNWL